MSSESALLQSQYLDSLLNSNSQQAVHSAQRIILRNQICQDHIVQGKLIISLDDQIKMKFQPHSHQEQDKETDIYRTNKTRSQRQSPEPKYFSKQDHQKFLKRIIEQKKILKLEKQARKKEIVAEMEKDQTQRRQILEESRLQKQIQKKRQLQEKINSISLQKEKRDAEARNQNKLIQKIMSMKPLHQRLEKNFLIQEAQGLEEKKKRLAQIRSLHKPITKQELQEHQKKYDEIREKMPKKQLDQSRERSSSLGQVYKSNFYKKAIEQSKEKAKLINMQKQLRIQQAYESQQKIRQYEKYVKGNFKPDVDNRLVQELKNQNSIQVRKVMTVQQHKQMGQDYLKFNIANKKQKPISEYRTTPTSVQDVRENQSNRLMGISLKNSVRERVNYSENKSKQKTIVERGSLGNGGQRRNLSVPRKQYKNDLQQDLRHIRRKEGSLNEIIDEKELDQLYQRILKVKTSMDKKK